MRWVKRALLMACMLMLTVPNVHNEHPAIYYLMGIPMCILEVIVGR